MSPEQQRIAIARACGITKCVEVTEAWKPAPYNVRLDGFRDGERVRVPDYLNDLNAMHEAEKVLSENPIYMQQHAFNNYAYALIDACKHQCNAVSATATQRAEAFLRTLNLWAE